MCVILREKMVIFRSQNNKNLLYFYCLLDFRIPWGRENCGSLPTVRQFRMASRESGEN